jgi:FkbM family methyltransferase
MNLSRRIIMNGTAFFPISKGLKNIYECLQDDESRAIFISRLNYFISGDICYFRDMIESALRYDSKSKHRFRKERTILSDLINIHDHMDIDAVLFGAGQNLSNIFPVLERIGLGIRAVCDSDTSKQGSKVNGFTIISPDEAVCNHSESYFVVTTFYGLSSVVKYLRQSDIPKNRIVYPHFIEEMYFGPEFIIPKENEFYIDVGLFNSSTIEQFVKLCDMYNVTYKKIIGLEPDKSCYESCCALIKEKEIRDTEIINKGAYSQSGTVRFDSSHFEQGVAKIDETGNDAIETIMIDELVDGEPVTFIKMDIEGAELEALKGASKTILDYKPRLAISIYHKPEDVVDILTYINSLVPEYRFWIRQYHYFGSETVLYALL